MKDFKFLKREYLAKLPKGPGAYAFKAKGRILYIGKATNIQDRIKNHFQQPGYRDNLFINQIEKLGYIKTDSEIEALILEAKLIKKYQPKYNVMWKDDKNYFFVAVTKEDFPRIFITHQMKPKLEIRNLKLEIKYVGPFVDGRALKQTLKILRKVFPYLSCKTLPKKPCLWYQLDMCLAPCLTKSRLGKQIPTSFRKIKKECQRNAGFVFKIIKGEKTRVLKELKKQMEELSKAREFEKAAKNRDQIRTLEKVFSHAKVLHWQENNILRKPGLNYHTLWWRIEKKLKLILKTKKGISRIEAYDVSNIQGQQATGSMVAFVNGRPNKNFYRRFKIKVDGKPNDIAMIKEILSRRMSHPEWGLPDLILIDGGRAQLNIAIKSKFQNPMVRLSSPLALSEVEVPNFKKVKIVALAKKKNELFVEGRGKAILLRNLPREIFNLILQLRDEAHRFAISYHRKLRDVDMFKETRT